jgi:hypothetical protein
MIEDLGVTEVLQPEIDQRVATIVTKRSTTIIAEGEVLRLNASRRIEGGEVALSK